jgi:serine protease Do
MTSNHERRGMATKLVGLTLAACAGVGLLLYMAPSSSAIEKEEALAARRQLKNTADLSTAFEDVAKALRPSVVNVRSAKRITAPAGLRELPDQQEMLRKFFGDDFSKRFFGNEAPRNGFGHRGGPDGGLQQRGLGTGVIVSKDGRVLTNAHVVRGADELTVTLWNKKNYKAKVIGVDDKTDVAVIKIDAKDLVPAELGDSHSVRVGEWVLAIGNPFGLTETVTSGIISAKGRANMGISDYEDFIQTDAAINPGNSGGPLVNLKGEVIGINTAILSESGGSMGIGFAIPIDMARSVMNSLVKYGKVERGYLGVNIQDLTEELAKSFGYEGTKGVLVADVTPDSPAGKAGLKAGDIITRLNGKPMDDMNQLRNAVAEMAPGTKVNVEVFRNGKDKAIELALGDRESDVRVTRGHETSEDLGITVRALTRDEARAQLKDENTKGVLVTEVKPGSLADNAGIRAGDVITAVGGKPVDSVGELHAAIGKQDLKNGIRMQILTDGVRHFVFLKDLA